MPTKGVCVIKFTPSLLGFSANARAQFNIHAKSFGWPVAVAWLVRQTFEHRAGVGGALGGISMALANGLLVSTTPTNTRTQFTTINHEPLLAFV